MSGQLFPLSALGMTVEGRSPYVNVLVDEAVSGKEARSTWMTSPRWKYRIGCNALTPAVLAQVQGIFNRHFGTADTFLLNDPADNAVTDCGFGVGDGATTAFQLQRSVGGAIFDAAGFSYTPQSKPILNMLRNASFDTVTTPANGPDFWQLYNNNSATEPTLFTSVPGMNGGKAARISWGINAALSGGSKGFVQTGTTTPAWMAGQWYTVAFFARAFGTVQGKYCDLRWNNPQPSFQFYITNPPLTANWQRYVFQVRWNSPLSPLVELYLTANDNPASGAGPSNCFGDLDFDEILVTPGAFDVPPQAFSTPATGPATRTPAYWPGYADGFEPVYDLAAPPTIYQDGDWMGRRQLYPYARENTVPFSEQFDNAAWGKTAATISANATTAPDGTATADQFNEGTANSSHYVLQTMSPAELVGELRCYSVFVKAGNLPNIRFGAGGVDEGLLFDLSAGTISSVTGTVQASGVQTSPLWPGWYRIWCVRRVTVTSSGCILAATAAGGGYSMAAYVGTSRTFYAWGAMCERTSNLNGPTPYIKTTTASVSTTDYSVSSAGLVTLTTAPAAPSGGGTGAYLSADLSYYKRVRLANPNLSYERIVYLVARAQLEMVSVKP